MNNNKMIPLEKVLVRIDTLKERSRMARMVEKDWQNMIELQWNYDQSAIELW